VLTSGRGFADPTVRYAAAETLDGVQVRRLAWGSLGKETLGARAIGGALFLIQAVVRGLITSRPKAILITTSPPMAPIAGLLLARLRRAPLTLWLMDLNPDQAIMTGVVKPGSISARLLELANRTSARATDALVVLDSFMADRIDERWNIGKRLIILPPLALTEDIVPVPHDDNPFRKRHGLTGKRVLMFSGNMSLVHPLNTVLQAAASPTILADDRLVFVFIGDGSQRATIEAAMRRDRLQNVLLLPYQPLSELQFSLSAADVHLVSMGQAMVGIVHPSKIYGAMAARRPVVYLGPQQSPIGAIVTRFDIGWHVEHGDMPGMISALRDITDASEENLAAKGRRARETLDNHFSQNGILNRFCAVLEGGIGNGVELGMELTSARSCTRRGQ